MHGFKSFPRKTEIPFTPGINVVLGPNGSGKSNISDALCFVLGRLSIKSMRAAKASNLIFLGTKQATPSKEASVEVVFDNSENVFTVKGNEVSIKRIVRKNGQSIYKINNETKTRQEVLTLLAQAGIDPNGFNIILQGEIQNFVRMQSEERRGIIEEVSGISVYEDRKAKSLRELEKTEDKLKEVNSILRERTAYLNNLEKERQEALRYKKLETDVKRFKASIIHFDLSRKKKESEKISLEINKKSGEIEKIKKSISGIENEIKQIQGKIDEINSKIQQSTGTEQEALNTQITNLRIELAQMNAKFENFNARAYTLSKQRQETLDSIREAESSVKELEVPLEKEKGRKKKEKDLEEKKRRLEAFEYQRKKYYMTGSELKSLRSLVEDKNNLLQNYSNESNFLLKQLDALSIGIFDVKANKEKLEKLKNAFSEKRNSLSSLLKKEMGLEKINSVNESEIENQKRTMEKIAKLDICPICKSKITREHMEEIKEEMQPRAEKLKKEMETADKQLKEIYQKKEILNNDMEELSQLISKTESDISKLSNIQEKKSQIKVLHEKTEKLKEQIAALDKKRKQLEQTIENNSDIEQKYENLKLELQEVSLRTHENVQSEVTFKRRELERLKISLKGFERDLENIKEESSDIEKEMKQRQSVLLEKKQEEEQLQKRFKELISKRDSLQKQIRERESETLTKQHNLSITEQSMNDLKIDKARTDAEAESFEAEMTEFSGVEPIKANKEVLTERLIKTQETLSRIGTVNLRSLEIYDSVRREYDSVKEKAEIITKEKEVILKVIHEIDIKKKKTFVSTLKQLNELFLRNFSQLSTKGDVFLEAENKQDPFEGGINIIVKTGHGKYFDVKSLSGGEQTLVALSLIFAIEEYRPYSFYIFDEIDAALDKRNSERLAGLLNKYMQQGQYIIITHNDEIISRATNLYGVSMHDGISKIISLKV